MDEVEQYPKYEVVPMNVFLPASSADQLGKYLISSKNRIAPPRPQKSKKSEME